MNAIRNYLETMFLKLPNTPEVRRAKEELLAMMEDKYAELINEGKSENEAVGTVISEFGNLSELAEDLGIDAHMQEDTDKRVISIDEVRDFLRDKERFAFLIGMGVFLCIASLVGPILTDALEALEAIGLASMFLCIAGGVVLFVYPSIMMNKWNYLKNEPSVLDFSAAQYVEDQREQFRGVFALLLTIGIIFCVICFIPVTIMDGINLKIGVMHLSSLGAAIMFVMIAAGVYMIVYAGIRNGSYAEILHIGESGAGAAPEEFQEYKSNQELTKSEFQEYKPKQELTKNAYSSKTAQTVMELYWPTVTCVYLIWSFLTFDWGITWLIWPVASVLHGALKNSLRK